MTVEFVTGTGAGDHVGAEDFGEYQAWSVGRGAYVLDGCEASVVDSNTIRISEGNILIGGRHVRVKGSEDVAIQSGAAGRNRNDLLVLRYTRDIEGIEGSPIIALPGSPVEGAATDPPYVSGDILAGDVAADYPLYRVPVTGLAVGEPVLLMERRANAYDLIRSLSDALAGKAPASHSHSASAITSGVLGMVYGGLGASDAPSGRRNLGITNDYIYGGTVLYDNPSGTTGTVGLSWSAASFSMIEIYYVTNDGGRHMAKVPVSSSMTADLIGATLKAYGDGGKAVYLKIRRVIVSGTTIYTTGDAGESMTNNANSCGATVNSGIIGITRVIGYV